MEIIRSFFDFVHKITAEIPLDSFVWIPWIVIAIVVIAALILKLTDKWRRGLGLALLLLIPLLYAAINALLFAYILMWPTDPRWATSRQSLEITEMPAPPDISGVPVVGERLNDWSSFFVDSINSTAKTFEVLSGDVNTIRAYGEAIITGLPYLLYAFAGLVVAGFVLSILLAWVFIKLMLLLNDVRLLMKERNARNRKAYEEQRRRAGHIDEAWPYQRSINFADNTDAYLDYAIEQDKLQQEGQLPRKQRKIKGKR